MTAAELRQYERWKQEVQFLRGQNQHLSLELNTCRPALHKAGQRIDRLERRVAKLTAENRLLKQQLKDRTPPHTEPPPFVKVRRPRTGPRRRPGREAGHAPAFRPAPSHIDQHIDVPLPTDGHGRRLCPQHRVLLRDVQKHRRVVEDIVPATVRVTCYHTVSGYCPMCDEYVESRDPQQPPAAQVPQSQVGLNTLATVAALRMHNRLPYAQITDVLQSLFGLKLCPGAMARQMQRMGRWLEDEYQHLKCHLRGCKVLGADETSWPVNAKDLWLWAVCDPRGPHTLYHVDRSRGRKVIGELLGPGFDGWLVSDFLAVYDQASPHQQKCLTHLARDLHDTRLADAEFAASGFCRRLRRLLKEMVALKAHRRCFKAAAYEHRVQLLEKRLEGLSGQSDSSQPQVRRLAGRLRRYAKHLTPFLRVRELPGNNSHTEREIRPMAVFRKVSGGSRSERGAKATAIMASIVRTTLGKGLNVVATIKQLLRRAWAGDKTPLLTPCTGTPDP